jgi:[protein-PII] uridylyltransferase
MLSDLADRLVLELAGLPGDATSGGGSQRTAGGDGLPPAARPSPGWALVALGGYGRRELCFHSDVDLMVLHAPAASAAAEAVARDLFHRLWDLRVRLGHSVRTVRECLALAARDLATRTSLLEGRLVAGDAELFDSLERALRRAWTGGRGGFVRELVAEHDRIESRHGSSLYALEPNVKKSGGGLRTIHFLRWVALARWGTGDPAALHARGHLRASEGRALREAQAFYWRVRNDLHLAAGRPVDVVSRDDQLRLARLFGYADEGPSLGVERFMRQYYLHATAVHDVAERLLARAAGKPRWRRALDRLRARTVDGDFVLDPDGLALGAAGRERVLADPARLVRLFAVAARHRTRIQPGVLESARAAAEVLDDAAFRTPAATAAFRELLAEPGGIADALSAMHRSRVLWKLLPEFRDVNRLVQFTRAHAFTVDEHTFQVLRTAEGLAGVGRTAESPGGRGAAGDAPVQPESPGRTRLRKAYAEIRRKDLLHLAILLHDAAKGRGGDHSAIGAGIAAAAARRFGYDEHDARLLALLVREHLTLGHAALRRDVADEKVLVDVARTAAHPEALRMLYVLTFADVAGMGPGSWTEWKEELLTALYVRVMDWLTGSREVADPAERVEAVRRELTERLGGRMDAARLEEQWASLRERYLLVTPVETIARHLEWTAALAPGDVRVEAENQAATGTTLYTVLAWDDLTPGVFARIAGVLAAKGLEVLRAQVDTRRTGVVVDTFEVRDSFFAGAPPPERLAEVSGAVREVLLGRLPLAELFERHRRFRPRAASPAGPPPRDTQVEVDNEASAAFTVVDVFAEDRQGLLHVIAEALREQGLSVHSARVATRLDQALDVFYVTDLAGRKVEDPERVSAIERGVAERIDEFVLEAPPAVRAPAPPPRDPRAARGHGRTVRGAS